MGAGGVSIGTGFLDIELKFPDLGRASAGAGAAVGKAIQGAGAGLGKALQGAAPAIRALGPALQGAFSGAGRGIGAALKGSAPAITSTGTALEKAFRGAGRGLGETTAGLGKGLGSAIAGTGAPIKSMGQALGSTSAGFGRGLGAAIKGTGSPITAMGTSFGRAVSGLGKGLKSVMEGANGLLKTALSPLTSLMGGGGGGGLGKLLALGGGVSAIGTLHYAAKEAMGLETAMIRLGRATDLDGAALGSLDADLRKMASTMAGADLSEVFGLATFGAKLGISGDDIRLFTRDMIKMSAVLEDISPEHAATEIARILNVFGEIPANALRAASALNILDMKSTASAADILQATEAMSGMASTIGMTIPQTMAFAAAMREAGVKVTVSGTAMSQFLMKMAGPQMSQFAEIAGKTKQEFRDLVNTKPFEAFEQFAKGLSGLSLEEKIVKLKALHFTGQQTGATMLQFIKVLDKLDPYAKAAAKDWSTMASIQDGYNKVSQSTEKQLQLMWNNVGLLMARIGDGLLPVIKGFSAGVANLAVDLEEFFKENKEQIIAWGESWGKTFRWIGLIWKEFPKIVEYSVEAAKEKFWQIVEVGRRVFVVLGNVFKAGGEFLADLMDQIGRNMAKHIEYAIMDGISAASRGPLMKALEMISPGFAATFKGVAGVVDAAGHPAIPAIAPDFDKFNKADKFAGLSGTGAAEAGRNFRGPRNPDAGPLNAMFGNLPRSELKEKLEAELNAAVKVQEAAKNLARAAADTNDATARKKAQDAANLAKDRDEEARAKVVTFRRMTRAQREQAERRANLEAKDKAVGTEIMKQPGRNPFQFPTNEEIAAVRLKRDQERAAAMRRVQVFGNNPQRRNDAGQFKAKQIVDEAQRKADVKNILDQEKIQNAKKAQAARDADAAAKLNAMLKQFKANKAAKDAAGGPGLGGPNAAAQNGGDGEGKKIQGQQLTQLGAINVGITSLLAAIKRLNLGMDA